MGLFIQKDDNRSELQQRIAAELQAKAKRRTENEDTPVDGVEDSEYLKGTKRTTSLAWVWVLIIFAAIGSIIWLLFVSK